MPSKKKPMVSVIMGSDSDWSVMKNAVQVLKQFKIPYESQVVSAHRTPKKMQEYALKAQERGIQVIIAGAGGSAHLPGMVASLTNVPVIGVPVRSTKLDGLDSLLSIVQMPKGIPVATVAIDNSYNAALLAIRVLGLLQPSIAKKLNQHQKSQKEKTIKANKRVQGLQKK